MKKIPALPTMKKIPRLESSGAEKIPSSFSAPKIKFQLMKAGSKFVLFVGDEGSILVYIKDNAVQSRHFVSDSTPANLKELNDILAQDTSSPILLVIDSMHQSYVHQTLPPVSSLSVGKLIKRRLDRDFGTNEIKGAILLGREKTGRKDWEFLMIALDKNPQLSFWIEYVSELPNRFQGIYLVSAEAELVVHNLQRAMGVPKEGTGSEWTFFVSHNKVGGFRQVILRDGRLIFMRMAQPIGESTPEIIAGNIEQEMLNTMEYMSRLSFTPQAGLDIYIIASAALKPFIDSSKFTANHFTLLTPFEAAQYLGIEGATQPADQFGDVILAAAIAGSKKHILTLVTPALRKLARLYKALLFQRIAAAAVVAGTLLYAGDMFYDMYNLRTQREDLEQSVAARQKNLEILRAEIKKTNLNVEKLADLIDLYQQLQKEKLTPTPLLTMISPVLTSPIAVKSVEWSLDETTTPNTPKAVAVFLLEFPGVDTPEAFKIVSKKVLADLKSALKGCEVAFTKLPPRLLETEKLDMSFNEKKTASASEPNQVQLTIKGDASLLTAATPAAAP